jgi:hypothetical protein
MARGPRDPLFLIRERQLGKVAEKLRNDGAAKDGAPDRSISLTSGAYGCSGHATAAGLRRSRGNTTCKRYHHPRRASLGTIRGSVWSYLNALWIARDRIKACPLP